MAKPKKPNPEEYEELAYEIGRLFLNFGGFEHVLNLTVAAALQLNSMQESAIVKGMMARQKIELLNAFGKAHWAKEATDKLKVLTAAAITLIEFRNDIAHGFTSHDKDGKIHLLTFRGANRFSAKILPLTGKEVGQHGAAAERLAYQFQALVDVLDAEHQRLREHLAKPRGRPAKK